MKILNNQKGQVMIAVMVLSFFFISSYFSFQAYWNSRNRALANAREAYNMMDATDQAARDVSADWATAAANSPSGASGAYIESQMAKLVPNPACSTACTLGAGCCTGGVVLCYMNPTANAFPYCFYGAGGTTTSQLELRLVIPQEKTSIVREYRVKIEDAVAKLIEKVYHNGAIESEALAAEGIGSRTDTVGTQPSCAPGGGATCTKCGTSAWSTAQAPQPAPICGTIYACPSSFTSCAGYSGSTTTGPSSNGPAPLFVQQFSLSFPGAPN